MRCRPLDSDSLRIHSRSDKPLALTQNGRDLQKETLVRIAESVGERAHVAFEPMTNAPTPSTP
jgi:hypothetical protein